MQSLMCSCRGAPQMAAHSHACGHTVSTHADCMSSPPTGQVQPKIETWYNMVYTYSYITDDGRDWKRPMGQEGILHPPCQHVARSLEVHNAHDDHNAMHGIHPAKQSHPLTTRPKTQIKTNHHQETQLYGRASSCHTQTAQASMLLCATLAAARHGL